MTPDQVDAQKTAITKALRLAGASDLQRRLGLLIYLVNGLKAALKFAQGIDDDNRRTEARIAVCEALIEQLKERGTP